jgi:tripartite-type tricarboxylate transporter receptor subunit TctC
LQPVDRKQLTGMPFGFDAPRADPQQSSGSGAGFLDAVLPMEDRAMSKRHGFPHCPDNAQLFGIAVAGLLCAPAATTVAQTGPAKPIRMVVPWPPGGANDIIGRALAQPLALAVQQNVVVDNRGGSNGMIGAEAVARAPGDGYTIMFHSINSHVTNPALHKKLAYDTIRDFQPVIRIASIPLVVVVHPSFPAKSIRDLIAIAKSHPGQVDYASFGQGSMSHLAGELLKTTAALQMVHIPYKGAGPALADALAGHVPVYFSSIVPALPAVTANRLRAIAVTAAQREKQLPEVAAVAETPGLKGYDATIEFAIWAPGATPTDIVNRINAAIGKVIHEPEFTERLHAQGASAPIGGTPQQMAEAQTLQMEKLAKLMRLAGIQPE